MNLLKLKKLLKEWRETKNLALATDICDALCDALGVR